MPGTISIMDAAPQAQTAAVNAPSVGVAADADTSASQFYGIMQNLLGAASTGEKGGVEVSDQQTAADKTSVENPKVKDSKSKPNDVADQTMAMASAAAIVIPNMQIVQPSDGTVKDGSKTASVADVTSQPQDAPQAAAMAVKDQLPNTADAQMKDAFSSAMEQSAADKTSPEKLGAEKALAENSSTEKFGAEKILTENSSPEKLGVEKVLTEKTSPEKLGAEKTLAENSSTEKLGTEKVPKENLTLEKASTGKSSVEKSGEKDIQTAAQAVDVVAEKNPADAGQNTPAATVAVEANVDAGDARTENHPAENNANVEMAAGTSKDAPSVPIKAEAGTPQVAQSSGKENMRGDSQGGESAKRGAENPSQLKVEVPKTGADDSSVQVSGTSAAKAAEEKTPDAKAATHHVEPSFDQALISASHDSAQANMQSSASAQVAEKAQAASSVPVDTTASARAINQIVKSAKLQLFDGGAGMTLRLDPPHLGTVQMDISSHHGTVTADLQTSSDSTKQLLEADISTLRQSLSDAGVHVDSINVHVGSNSTQSWNFQGGQRDQNQDTGRHPHLSSPVENGSAEAVAAQTVSAQQTSTGGLNYLA